VEEDLLGCQRFETNGIFMNGGKGNGPKGQSVHFHESTRSDGAAQKCHNSQ